MANIPLLSLPLILLLFFNGCIATQQYKQLQNKCQIHRLNALEAIDRLQAEAGETEFWDFSNQQFQCAGVHVIRHRIQPRGLLLPSYSNTPLLAYIEQGRGIQSVMLPGCPEMFQSSQKGQQEELRGETFQDHHQKIQQFRQGDVLAFPAGAAHWLYNDGEDDLIAIVLIHTSSDQNQLDQTHRRFFLAGTPDFRSPRQAKTHEPSQGAVIRGCTVFKGFDVRLLAEAFNVDTETARKLQGQEDQRGHIIRIEGGLQVTRPPFSRQEQEHEERQQGGSVNGLEETICTARLRQNIDDTSSPDFYNPQAGKCNTLNSFKFPILRTLQLSIERGVLHRNAMVSPHWTLNAHNIVYVTRGSMQVQIVNNQGEAVFDNELREGQLVLVPQNFVVVKQAREQGCRWVTFMTNDNAIIDNLAGRTSALRGMPADVLANAYKISRQQAQRLKLNREETVMFSPSSRSRVRGIRYVTKL